jgi:hypothetical protein
LTNHASTSTWTSIVTFGNQQATISAKLVCSDKPALNNSARARSFRVNHVNTIDSLANKRRNLLSRVTQVHSFFFFKALSYRV